MHSVYTYVNVYVFTFVLYFLQLNAGRGDVSRLSDSIKSLEQRVASLKEEKDEFKGMYERSSEQVHAHE